MAEEDGHDNDDDHHIRAKMMGAKRAAKGIEGNPY